MPSKTQDDELVMSLVELALARPRPERGAYIDSACSGDADLITEVWKYVDWEERMGGFLRDPLYPAPGVEPPFEPGELLAGRFRIVREVDEGGMGIVYDGVDEKLERRIAIKCAKAGFHKRLPPEVRHASEISHPNVCKIHEIHTAYTSRGEVDFLTMEFLEGETLAQRLRRGRLPEPAARLIARQLCAGLAEAHRHGVVHGDLKSSNVILAHDADGSERAVITDFGLARGPAGNAARGRAPSLEAGGSPDYMAPELWKGEKASPASDVYALGVMLCELAVGRRPFGPDVALEERLTARPPAIHPKWDRVLSRCLDPDPARRFAHAGEVAKALDPPRPRRLWLTAAAALVLAAAVGGITYERATAPKESWRLQMLPIEASSPDLAGLANDLSNKTASQLARIKGGNVARLSFIPPEKNGKAAGATHVIHASLAKENGKLVLHSNLLDSRHGVSTRLWSPAYAPGEERYAPVALAGMVTANLKLPPLAVAAVQASAAKDYWDGVWYTRQNSTLEPALAALQRAVEKDPDSPLTWAALAEAQWFAHNYTKKPILLDRATDSLRQAEDRNPDTPAAHRVEGYLAYENGFYGTANAEFERAIALQPNAIAYIWLGKSCEDSNQLQPALAAFEKARELEPGYFRTYQNLGGYYYHRGDIAKFAEYQKKAVDLAPDEPNQRSNLAIAYRDLGRFKEAEDEFNLSLKLQENAAADANLGEVLMYEGKEQDAVARFQRTLALDSEPAAGGRAMVLIKLAIAYRRLGELDKAAEVNQRGLEMARSQMARNPRDGWVNAALGYFSAALGDRLTAESETARALALFPDDTDTRWRAVLTYEELFSRFKDPSLRNRTLEILMRSNPQVLADIGHWPDLADLHQDPRFQALLAQNK